MTTSVDPSSDGVGGAAHAVSEQDEVFVDHGYHEDNGMIGVHRSSTSASVTPDTRSYLARIGSLFADANVDQDEVPFVVRNVYREMEGQECDLLMDKKCSKVLESIIKRSSVDQLRTFLHRVCMQLGLETEPYVELCCNPYASHALETFLAQVTPSMARLDTPIEGNDTGVPVPSLKETISTFAKRVSGDWTGMMCNRYATHILRALLLCCSGLQWPSAQAKKRWETKQLCPIEAHGDDASAAAGKKAHLVPRSWSKVVASVARAVVVGEHEHHEEAVIASQLELLCDGYASPAVQVLLYAVARARQRLLQPLVRSILALTSGVQGAHAKSVVFANPEDGAPRPWPVPDVTAWLDELVRSPSGSRCVESALVLGDEAAEAAFMQHYLRGRMVSLSQHALANHVVQAFVANMRNDAAVLPPVWHELHRGNNVQRLLERGRAGVVLHLLRTAARHSDADLARSMASHVVDALCAAMKSPTPTQAKEGSTPVNVAALALALPSSSARRGRGGGGRGSKGAEGAELGVAPVSALGAQLLHVLIDMGPHVCPHAGASLAKMDGDALARVACNRAGSELLEGVLGSRTVPLKQRKAVCKRLQSQWADLALHACGSRIVDAAYKGGTSRLKETIAAAVSSVEPQLRSLRWGAHVLRNCRITQRKRDVDAERHRMRHQQAKVHMFADILDDGDNDVVVVDGGNGGSGGHSDDLSAPHAATDGDISDIVDDDDEDVNEDDGVVSGATDTFMTGTSGSDADAVFAALVGKARRDRKMHATRNGRKRGRREAREDEGAVEVDEQGPEDAAELAAIIAASKGGGKGNKKSKKKKKQKKQKKQRKGSSDLFERKE